MMRYVVALASFIFFIGFESPNLVYADWTCPYCTVSSEQMGLDPLYSSGQRANLSQNFQAVMAQMGATDAARITQPPFGGSNISVQPTPAAKAPPVAPAMSASPQVSYRNVTPSVVYPRVSTFEQGEPSYASLLPAWAIAGGVQDMNFSNMDPTFRMGQFPGFEEGYPGGYLINLDHLMSSLRFRQVYN